MINRILSSNFAFGFVDIYLMASSWWDLVISSEDESAEYAKAWFNDLTNVVQLYNDYKREGLYHV
jgi:hypothetical protein